jgi:hypothetical protein
MPSPALGQRVHLSKVLRPLHKNSDPNDAPSFNLVDAVVKDEDGTMTSVLVLAKAVKKLTITGRLEYDPELAEHCKYRLLRCIPV